jgi:limonene 1,2-monooxygenase
MARMRFGIFMAPFHSPSGQSPTVALERDVETVQLLDRLGYDEAWIGEHHSWFHPLGDTLEERIAWVNESGVGVIGTPEDAVAKIDELYKQSNGGFGCYLMMAHEWARPEAVNRHYELFAQHVIPKFQGSIDRLLAAERFAQGRWEDLNTRQANALTAWTEKHAEERATRG